VSTFRTATVAGVGVVDAVSEEWLSALRGVGTRKDEAVGRLHAMMLRVARWQMQRLHHTVGRIDAGELDVLAQQAADDATIAVLAHLGDYEGRSRFTTWAFKFAVWHASTTLRRHRWRDREIPTEPQDWPYQPDPGARPEQLADAVDLAAALRSAIATGLTPHQRDVLVALAVNDVPIDVLADRLGTSRGALYKTLHDARGRLRSTLTDAGFEPPPSRRETAR
jgi:RNA polymerase sigma-70 factor (ECF subfamily)